MDGVSQTLERLSGNLLGTATGKIQLEDYRLLELQKELKTAHRGFPQPGNFFHPT